MIRNKKRWIAGIVTGVITTVIADCLTKLNLIANAFRGIRWFFGLFASTIEFPIWGLMVIWFSGPLLIAIISWLANRKESDPALDYKADSIFGVNWHWDYSGGGSIIRLYPTCPTCSMELKAVDVRSYEVVPRTSLICEGCNFRTEPFAGHPSDVECLVEKEIRRRIRTDQYKKSNIPL
jgi:hypothetical protein